MSEHSQRSGNRGASEENGSGLGVVGEAIEALRELADDDVRLTVGERAMLTMALAELEAARERDRRDEAA